MNYYKIGSFPESERIRVEIKNLLRKKGTRSG
jgi:hypothetical protein